jgi:predicted ATPase
MKKIVITGGPCSGKTAVIEELRKIGFPVLEETAKEIVALRKHIPVTKEESDIRQDLIFNKQFAKEQKAEKENYDVLFLDRSLIDGLAYAVLYSGEKSIEKYLPAVRNKKYDYVFILDLLPFNPEGFRSENENEEEAKRIHNSILELYQRLGYEPVSVPVMSIEHRVGFILEKILDS